MHMPAEFDYKTLSKKISKTIHIRKNVHLKKKPLISTDILNILILKRNSTNIGNFLHCVAYVGKVDIC